MLCNERTFSLFYPSFEGLQGKCYGLSPQCSDLKVNRNYCNSFLKENNNLNGGDIFVFASVLLWVFGWHKLLEKSEAFDMDQRVTVLLLLTAAGYVIWHGVPAACMLLAASRTTVVATVDVRD